VTVSDAPPAPSNPEPDAARRLVLADLVAGFAAGLIARATDYERAATRAEGLLRHSLEDLAHAKHAEIAALAPLVRALGLTAPTAGPPGPLRPWGVVLGEAFQAERTLGRAGRELAALEGDPATRALTTRLLADVGRDREEVRRLYLRYT
jgi:hypothetical protein